MLHCNCYNISRWFNHWSVYRLSWSLHLLKLNMYTHVLLEYTCSLWLCSCSTACIHQLGLYNRVPKVMYNIVSMHQANGWKKAVCMFVQELFLERSVTWQSVAGDNCYCKKWRMLWQRKSNIEQVKFGEDFICMLTIKSSYNIIDTFKLKIQN